MKKFLETIYGGLTGKVDVITLGDESDAPDSERWFDFPKDLSFMDKYLGVRSDEDVYVSVASFSSEVRTGEDPFAKSRTVWADADTCDPENFRLPPSVVVQTSPGKWHVWWVLDEPVLARDASDIAHRISVAHADQGCDRGWHISKILRVPGTSNNKYGEPYEVSVTYNDVVYTLEQMHEAYADVDVTPNIELSSEVPESLSEDEVIDLQDQLVGWGLQDLYLRKPEEGQSWSERMFRLELELFRNGLTAQQVFSLMREAPVNKFNPDNAGQRTQTGVKIPKRGNPDLAIWKDVQKAYAEHVVTEDIRVEDRGPKDYEQASFLSMDERELLADNPTFIDEYVSWALERSPESAPAYHYALSWMALSCAFADRCYLDLRWGKTFPNLWVFIAGDSTRTRKSTAGNLMMRVVHAIEAVEMDEIDIGSDATAEALIQVLGAKDGRTAILRTDEIAGFFREAMVKNYRSGTLEIFTQIYDGETPVVRRATKGSGNTKRTRAVFNFLGIGIREKIAENLSRDHFESGFLLRTTWAVADSPAYRQGDSDISEAVELDGTRDVGLANLVSPLAARRVQYDPDNPVRITIGAEALTRINRFAHDMHVYAQQKYQDAVLDAAVDRLRDSVLKAAALLSVYYGDTEITEFIMLRAIQQGEAWFHALIRMLGEVSNTGFGRTLDQVERYLSTGSNHQRQEADIYRKFTFKPNEFNDVMTTLRMAGRVRRVPNAQGRWEALG